MKVFTIHITTVVLLSTAVFVCGCARRTSLDSAIQGADRVAWEQAAPGMLESLRSEDVSVQLIPLGNQGEVGLMTGYATPRVLASTVRSRRFAYPLHSAPKSGTAATRREIHEQELLAGRELCWLEDRLEAYLIQVNGSAVVDWVDEDGRETGETSTIVWSASNKHAYQSLGRMAIDAGLSHADEMSLNRLRTLHRTHPEMMAGLMLENPRYIMFRLLEPGETLCGSRGRPLVAGVSLAADPECPTDTLLLIEPLDGSPPSIGLVHDGGAAIVGVQRLDRYFGSGKRAMEAAGSVEVPIVVSRIKISGSKKE